MYRYVEYDHEYRDTATRTFVGGLVTLIKIFNTFYTYHLKYDEKIDKDKLNSLIYMICMIHATLYLVMNKLAKDGLIPYDVLLVASFILPMNASNYLFLDIIEKGDRNEIYGK